MENWEYFYQMPLGLVCVSLNVCVCVDYRRKEWLKMAVCVVQREMVKSTVVYFHRKWALMSFYPLVKLGSGCNKWDV